MKKLDEKIIKKYSSFAAVYTFLFALCSLLIFSCFHFSERTLISSDGVRQHYIAFAYFGKYIREIIKGVIAGKSLTIQSYSFGIGFGDDILQTMNFYAFGDPLNLLSVAFPVRYSYVAYIFLIYFRLWLAGITFSLFCRHKGVKSRAGICAGALCYVLTVYTFNFGTMHPFFLNPLIYLPLLLMGVDYVIDNGRPYLLTLTVFISAISNFYFFYMLAVVTAVYALLRLIIICGKNVKQLFKSLFCIAFNAVIGVLMSCAVFVPVAMAFLSDSRGDVKLSLDLFFGARYYLNIPSAFIVSTSAAGEAQTLLGYSSIAVPAIIVMFMKKSRGVEEKILFLMASVSLCLPLVAVIMNGFAYPSNRWVWAYAMLVSYILASNWKYMISLSKKEKAILLVITAAYTLLVFVTKQELVKDSLVICSAMLVCALLFATNTNKKFKSTAALFLVAFTVAANGFLYYALPENSAFIEKFAPTEYITENFTESLGKAVKKASKDKSFYRYSHYTDEYDYNKDLLFNTRGASAYWSLQNPNTAEFFREMEMPYTYLYKYHNLDRRASLNTLLNVKYYCTEHKSKLPYGYELLSKNVLNGNEVYEAKNYLPMFYSYSTYITREQYDSLNPVQKEEAIMNSVLLDEDLDGFSKGEISTQSISVPFIVTESKGVKLDGDSIKVSDKTSPLTLEFSGVENSEVYLRFKNSDFENKEKEASFSVVVTPYSADKKENRSSAKIMSKNGQRYDGREYYTLCLGYFDDAIEKLEIRFGSVGTYTLSDIEVICLPMQNFDKTVSALKEDSVENVFVGTDLVKAKVNAEKDKIFVVSIPYSKGWKAYVDGQEVELLRANTMLSAIPVTAGEHDIRLTYKTPYLNFGLCMSAVGVVLFAGLIIYTERKNKITK